MQEPDAAVLGVLYRELGFNSLLKELLTTTAGASDTQSTVQRSNAEGTAATIEKKDYLQFENVDAFKEYLKNVPADRTLALWLNLNMGERETEGFGTPVASLEVSSEPGEGRAIWIDEKGEVLKALEPLLRDKKRQKIVHDPKLFQLLGGKTEAIAHATQLYSYLLKPTTGNHNFVDVVFREFNVPMGGGPGERADYLQRTAAALRGQLAAQELLEVYEKIDLPLAAVLAEMERVGIRVDPKALERMSQ